MSALGRERTLQFRSKEGGHRVERAIVTASVPKEQRQQHVRNKIDHEMGED